MRLTRSMHFWISVVILPTLAFPLSAPASGEPWIAPSTRRMANLLEKIDRETELQKHPFRNRERAESLRQALQGITNQTEEALNQRFYLALEWLQLGVPDKAVQELDQMESLLTKERRFSGAFGLLWAVRLYRAIAYLRLGIQENCLGDPNPEACLFPIRGEGVHRNPQGARKAISGFTDYLRRFPGDLRARWLLNLACAYVGEYPDQVPAQWRIDPKVFASDYDIKRFPNLAPDLGLAVNDLAGSSIVDDFDGDGCLDIMISNWSVQGQLRFFRNNADGSFTERTREAGLTGEVGGLNILQTDYNNDGYPDVYILRGAWWGDAGRYPNSLLRNNRDGTFTDATEEAGLLTFHPTQTAVWFDYNNDGWLDVFVGNESTGEEIHPCELFRNNGDGTFTECAAQVGLAHVGFVKGVASGDFDNNSWTDLYLSLRGRPNVLYRNDGSQESDKSSAAAWNFTDVSVQAGVIEPLGSFPTWFWDYDNDGGLDLFVSDNRIENVGDIAADYLRMPHDAERSRLYHNNHDGTFTDVTRASRLYKVLYAMGCNFGDLDNDGYLDFYLGTGDPDFGTLVPNRMFRNANGRFFQDVTTAGGFGNLQKGHGISFADLDNDGDQDIYEVMGGAKQGDNFPNALFENPGHGNHWITLKLEGVKSNRAAIGARIRVIVSTSNGERSIYRTVGTGGSFGANPLRQEIGLGQSREILRAEIFWPVTGQTQIVKNLEMDRFYRVREGEVEAERWDLPSFKLAPKTSQETRLRFSGLHGLK